MKEKIPNRKQYRKADKSMEELRKLIDSLDLECIKASILEQFRWSGEALVCIEKRYRNFLFLCGSTEEIIIPTAGVDIFWHHHILDTLKYHDDCQRIFGFYLHHFPYIGKQGDEDELEKLFRRTKQLYEATFGEAYVLTEAMDLDPNLADRLGASGERCG